jgi:hypothetical protein
MSATPKADPAKCDVVGCGMLAAMMTDGTEEDVQKLGRKPLPKLNVCSRHTNWPFSEDAKQFAITNASYRAR